MSWFRCQVSGVTCCMSCVRCMCQVSRVACHLSLTQTATATDHPPVNFPIMQSRLVCKDPQTQWAKSLKIAMSPVSCVVCHLSPVMCCESPVTCHMSPTPTARATDPSPAKSSTMHSKLVRKDSKSPPKVKNSKNFQTFLKIKPTSRFKCLQ